MILLLLAMQLSSSNCIAMGPNMVHCDTMDMTPPQAPPYQTTDWGAIFEKMRENHRSKAVGQLLANGDCAGAERYAIARGDFELASNVRAYCAAAPTMLASSAPPITTAEAETAAASGPHKVRAKTRSGYCLDVPPGYVGTGAANSPAVSTAMPRCDQLSARN